MLWTFKELVELHNADYDDGSDEISYYSLRSTVDAENHIFKVGDTEEDVCCQKCENLGLLLIGIRRAIPGPSKINSHQPRNIYCPVSLLSQKLSMLHLFQCKHSLKKLPEVSFAKWVVVDGHNKKVELTDSGESIAEPLKVL